jgi:hypothetical protein
MSRDSEQTTYAAAFLRERIRSDDVSETHPHAGIVPSDESRELLNTLATAFDSSQHPELSDVSDSDLYNTVLTNEGTDTLTQAVSEGNVSQMQYGIGQVDHEKDAGSGAYRAWLHPTVISEASVMFVTGGMNAGKTDWGHGVADEWHMVTRGRILSNLESAAEQNERVEHVDTFEEVETLFKKSRDHFFLIVDETGQGLTGTGTDQQKADVLASLLKLVRKGDAPPGTKRCICFIGQTVKDLNKDLRRLVAQTGAFVHKASKKKLEVYGDSLVSTNAEIQSTNPEQTFNGIPKSRITFDTTEEPIFDMSGALEDGESRNPDDVEDEMKEQHAQRLRDEGMSGTDIAEIVGMSKTWVYNHTEKPDDE